MSNSEQWTIESIRDALGAPALAQRFLSEINRAPAHQLLHVFARWERIAKNMRGAFQDADEIAAHEARGEQPPGEWIDGTDRLRRAADRIHSQGAA
ncbi:hypothetical protein ACG5V6_21470 [Streptomyces chitinivorans]|uniref:Uncharacterized protein n=1 Tax=Streptomyces chitinivorans TaxID=1257027 RepID=A0ABW7HYF1_9ACTN|nr:hypothetical protein [Streptomyces chitinivorans]MDH2410218.1 hypothetical protein [Streptomyces chitinivorans]